MTDETPDDAVKPQVIDLEAEDVSPVEDEPKAEAATSPEPPPRPRPQHLYRWLGVAVLAGALGGGIFYRGVLSSYLPTDAMQSMDARLGSLEANTVALSRQLTAVSAAAAALKSQTGAFDAAIKQTAEGSAAAHEQIAALATHLAAAETVLNEVKSSLEALKQTPAATGGTVDGSALTALALRIEVLEKDMASLKSSGNAGGGETVAALSRALADLKARIAAGAAYQDEYDRIARMVPAAEGLDILADQASRGLPGAQALAAELKELMSSLPQPSGGNGAVDAGYWSSFWNTLISVVKIRDIGEADWPALAAECASLAAAGDLTQAVALVDKTEGDKPAALAQWRDRAAARLKLEAALEQVSQAVLRQIAALGGGQ